MPNSDMAAGQMRATQQRTPEELAELEAAQDANYCELWKRRITREIAEAEQRGVIITVERVSVPPLAMGNHVAVVTARGKR